MTGGRAGVTLDAVTELEERETVVLCQTGRDDDLRTGFRRIYERYFDEVHRFEERLLADQHAAEDATQETFVRLHRALKTIDGSRPLRPYVLAVARNVAIDFLRARQKGVKLLPEGEDPAAPATADHASALERRAIVEDALAALGPEHRSILVLRHVHEQKLETIAEGASCTVRTVRNRLRAAGTLLGRELKRRGVVSGEVRS
jgi:RNA polymerase sigma-70 factor (ECF subfamily)